MGMKRYRNGFAVTLHEDMIDLPMMWKQSRFVFVNSMSDLFHKDVTLAFIRRIFSVMEQCPQHTFQVLTKRSERLREVAKELPWPSNVWMGVSVENATVVSRIDDLRHVPATVRFLSVEPLIGPIDALPLEGIHWVIVGGESGPGARPMQREWVKSIHHQCIEAQVPFFFKQWGGPNKKKAGRELDGDYYNEMPSGYVMANPPPTPTRELLVLNGAR
jgi:protein gp37